MGRLKAPSGWFQQKDAGISLPGVALAELWDRQATQALLSEGCRAGQALGELLTGSASLGVQVSTDQCRLLIGTFLNAGWSGLR